VAERAEEAYVGGRRSVDRQHARYYDGSTAVRGGRPPHERAVTRVNGDDGEEGDGENKRNNGETYSSGDSGVERHDCFACATSG
jgi:hypothetical protein